MDYQEEPTREENVLTEQDLALREEQLANVTGGASQFGMRLVNSIMHTKNPDPSWRGTAHEQADIVRTQIRESANEGRTFRVNKDWTKPLRRGK